MADDGNGIQASVQADRRGSFPTMGREEFRITSAAIAGGWDVPLEVLGRVGEFKRFQHLVQSHFHLWPSVTHCTTAASNQACGKFLRVDDADTLFIRQCFASLINSESA